MAALAVGVVAAGMILAAILTRFFALGFSGSGGVD
jgi:hypothetical protein